MVSVEAYHRQRPVVTNGTCSVVCSSDQICLCDNYTDCRCQTVCSSAENKEVYLDQNGQIISVCPVGENKCLNCCPSYSHSGCSSCCSSKSEALMRSELTGIVIGSVLGGILVISLCVCYCFIMMAICAACRKRRRQRQATYAPNAMSQLYQSGPDHFEEVAANCGHQPNIAIDAQPEALAHGASAQIGIPLGIDNIQPAEHPFLQTPSGPPAIVNSDPFQGR